MKTLLKITIIILMLVGLSAKAQAPFKIYGNLLEYRNYYWYNNPKQLIEPGTKDTVAVWYRNGMYGIPVDLSAIGSSTKPDSIYLKPSPTCMDSGSWGMIGDSIMYDTCGRGAVVVTWNSTTNVLCIDGVCDTLDFNGLWILVNGGTANEYIKPVDDLNRDVTMGTFNDNARLSITPKSGKRGISVKTNNQNGIVVLTDEYNGIVSNATGGGVAVDATSNSGTSIVARSAGKTIQAYNTGTGEVADLFQNNTASTSTQSPVLTLSRFTNTVTGTKDPMLLLKDTNVIGTTSSFLKCQLTPPSGTKTLYELTYGGVGTYTDGTKTLDLKGDYIEGKVGVSTRFKVDPSVTNGATAKAYILGSETSLVTPGAKIVSFQNAGVEKAYIDALAGDVVTNNNFQTAGGALTSSTFLNITTSNGTNDITVTPGIGGFLKFTNIPVDTSYYTVAIKQDGTVIKRVVTGGSGLPWVNGKLDLGDVSGGNYTQIESDGTIKYNGNATTWEDLQGSFSTGKTGTVDYPAFVPDSGYYSFVVDTTAPSVCKMYYIMQMPHSWKEGSSIYPHIHYKYETAVGKPRFMLKYRWFNIGSATYPPWNWCFMIDPGTPTNGTMSLATGTAISGSGKTISSMLICEVYLYSQDGTGDVHAYSFDIHYEKDTNGSRTETAK